MKKRIIKSVLFIIFIISLFVCIKVDRGPSFSEPPDYELIGFWSDNAYVYEYYINSLNLFDSFLQEIKTYDISSFPYFIITFIMMVLPLLSLILSLVEILLDIKNKIYCKINFILFLLNTIWFCILIGGPIFYNIYYKDYLYAIAGIFVFIMFIIVNGINYSNLRESKKN